MTLRPEPRADVDALLAQSAQLLNPKVPLSEWKQADLVLVAIEAGETLRDLAAALRAMQSELEWMRRQTTVVHEVSESKAIYRMRDAEQRAEQAEDERDGYKALASHRDIEINKWIGATGHNYPEQAEQALAAERERAERYRKALDFYAREQNYIRPLHPTWSASSNICVDRGFKARAALAEEKSA